MRVSEPKRAHHAISSQYTFGKKALGDGTRQNSVSFSYLDVFYMTEKPPLSRVCSQELTTSR